MVRNIFGGVGNVHWYSRQLALLSLALEEKMMQLSRTLLAQTWQNNKIGGGSDCHGGVNVITTFDA